jgi:hypothetical protein
MAVPTGSWLPRRRRRSSGSATGRPEMRLLPPCGADDRRPGELGQVEADVAASEYDNVPADDRDGGCHLSQSGVATDQCADSLSFENGHEASLAKCPRRGVLLHGHAQSARDDQ